MNKHIIFNACAPVLDVYGDNDLTSFVIVGDVCTAIFRLRYRYVEYDRCIV
jgi:hypothetical protein